MHEVLVDRLGGLSQLRKNVVSLTDRSDMTIDVYRGRKIITMPAVSKTTVFFKLKRTRTNAILAGRNK